MRLKQKKGYTLIELLVVIAIIGIAASLAIYNLVEMLPSIRSNSAARQVATDMQWARLRAVAENNDYIITFYSPDNNGKYRYEIHDDDDNDTQQDSGEEVKTGDNYTLPSGMKFGRAKSGVERTTCGGEIGATGIHFTGTPPKVTFNPTGRPNKNGSVYIIPTNESESGTKKTVNWKAISVTTNGRVKTWIYDSSVQNCSNSQGPWK